MSEPKEPHLCLLKGVAGLRGQAGVEGPRGNHGVPVGSLDISVPAVMYHRGLCMMSSETDSCPLL